MNIYQNLRYGIVFCIALFIIVPSVFSQDTAQDMNQDFEQDTDLLSGFVAPELLLEKQTSSKELKSSVKLEGEHILLGAIPTAEDSLVGEVAPALVNQVQLSFDQGQGLALVAGLDLQSRLGQIGQSSQLKHQLRPLETYVGLYDLNGIWSFYLGWQNFGWGAADKISPIDILNSRDLQPSPRRQKKLAVLAAQFQLQPLPWLGFEAVYLPFYQGNQIDILSQLNKELASMKAKAVLDKTELNFDEPTLGGRLRFYLPNFDIGLSYLFTPDDNLTASVSNLKFDGGKGYVKELLELLLKRKQLHHWGLDLRLAFPEWSLWLDTAFALDTEWELGSYTVRSPKLSSVLGADFNYGPDKKFYTNFQYSLRWLPDYQDSYSGIPKTKWDFKNLYALLQFNNKLANYNEGLLQRFILHMAFPFTINTTNTENNSILNLISVFNLAYDIPLLYKGVGAHHIYINPELEMSWDWQTSITHSLQLGLAIGFEWFAKLEQEAVNRGYYQDQIYLELRLLW